jgi:FemAB-related protein (PEP-CTERM system-associated)
LLTCRPFDDEPSVWNAFVRSHPDGTFFHQYEWLQVVREVYGGTPYYLAAYDDGRLVGVLPLMLRRVLGAGRILISVPFADEGGICANSSEAEQALLEAARVLGTNARAAYVELRQVDHALPGDFPCDLSRVTLVRALPATAEELWHSLDRKVRNQVRKAERAGLSVRHGGDDLLRGFYEVYARNTRDLGSPMHSLRFFTGVAYQFPSYVRVVTVALEKQVVGGALAAVHGITFTVPWAASLRAHFARCPNNLLYWRLLELAVEAGCRWFDFGRSGRDSGTYRFKKQWGSTERQLHYQFLPTLGRPAVHERREGLAYRAFARLWPHVPMPIARAVGPRIFARLPI